MCGPASPGGEGEDASGLAIAHPRAEADVPKARALGKRAVSLVGSMAEVEQAVAGATQPPSPRVEGASESGEGRPAPANTEVVPPPPPLSFWKHQAEAPALAPRKALKVSTSSTAQWVMEAQATIQRGTALAKAALKEPDAQGEATEAATQRAGDEAPMSLEAEAHKLDRAEAPLVAKATEGEAKVPKTSEAEVTEVGASRTTEAELAEAGALETTEAEVGEADVGAVELVAQEAETEVGQASVPPPVQDPPPLQESAQEVEELEAWSLEKLLFLQRERDVWDQLQRQKDLLAYANELLSAQSTEVEDLHLRLEKEVSWAAKASVEVQAVLEVEIEEHNTLQSAARTTCEALEVEGVESDSSLGSRLITLSGQVRE
ncbi:uncharacterized protein [Miscanthus floridulus]|uniref:uncharacterized protein n=1 Tax=Miscanthus floridulus TaxID=154761 RepID=UPI00345813E2